MSKLSLDFNSKWKPSDTLDYFNLSPDSGPDAGTETNYRRAFKDTTGKLAAAGKKKNGDFELMFALDDNYGAKADFRVGTDGKANQQSGWKIYQSKGLEDVMAIALAGASFALPGLGTALGSSLGFSGATASAIGSGLISGIGAELTGGDFLKGAVSGAIGGAGGSLASGVSELTGLSDTASRLITRAAIGGVNSEIQGGDFLNGVVLASLPGVKTGSSIVDFALNTGIRTGVKNTLGQS